MPSAVYDQVIAAQLQVRPAQVAATIELLDGGNTLPFIARYRKEVTGNLDEEQIRALSEALDRLRALDDRRRSILDSLTAQGQLTPDLQAQLSTASTLTALEDLYQPYKPKRRTRAGIAREKGLQGLADLIVSQMRSPQSASALAGTYLNDQVPDVAAALDGARDIVAELISDHAEVRGQVRERAQHVAGGLHAQACEARAHL